ncbi:MAG: response regulator [Chloroflexi bacterium]|nr:response regulator [Chloroflexota bacterium]
MMNNVKTVLVVEDEEAVRALITETIRDDSRYRLLEAKNGKEALDIARKEIPDVVILDVIMPIYDGFEVCRQIKSDPKTQKAIVLMLSALAQESNKEMGRQAGADDYLIKPFSPTALIRILDSVLGQ